LPPVSDYRLEGGVSERIPFLDDVIMDVQQISILADMFSGLNEEDMDSFFAIVVKGSSSAYRRGGIDIEVVKASLKRVEHLIKKEQYDASLKSELPWKDSALRTIPQG
jgi:hypothetical protein